MAATWAPQEGGLLELVELFKQSQTAHGAGQAKIADVSLSAKTIHDGICILCPHPYSPPTTIFSQRLDALSQIPDYANYLAFTLAQLTSEDVNVRSVAGLILKNHLLFNRDRIPLESIEYIKQIIIPALSFHEDLLRRTATQVVAMLIAIQGPENWQAGLEKLIGLMMSQDVCEAEVSQTATPFSPIQTNILTPPHTPHRAPTRLLQSFARTSLGSSTRARSMA